jgi:NTP pyrophosphatase (non-canonical NTP hydrolase)
MMKVKEEFERLHREIAELQQAIMDQAGKDRQQVSSMAYQLSREYGEISRRIAKLEGKT